MGATTRGSREDGIVLERRCCVARGNDIAEGRRTKENEAAAAVAAAAAAAATAAEVEEKVKVENSEGAGGLKVAGQSLTLFLCSY